MRIITSITIITHGNPPRMGGASVFFFGRADLSFAIPLRLAHPGMGLHRADFGKVVIGCDGRQVAS